MKSIPTRVGLGLREVMTSCRRFISWAFPDDRYAEMRWSGRWGRGIINVTRAVRDDLVVISEKL